MNVLDQPGTLVGWKVFFGHFISVALAHRSECCPYVSDFVNLWRRLLFIFKNGIVVVLQVPIGDQPHHDPQTVELASTVKGIVAPVPGISFLVTVGWTL